MQHEPSSNLGEFVEAFGHASATGRASAPPPDSTDELAARKARHVKFGVFRSPEDAPPRCEPNGGDRTMLSYRCPRAVVPISWGVPAEPRAWGYDRDFMPEDTWCPVCATEGELQHVESAQEHLSRLAPELSGVESDVPR
jgi:hypothetical protein